MNSGLSISAERIVIADDHPLFRTALRGAVERLLDRVTIIEAESLASLQAVMETGPAPDLLLLDLRMPGVQGFSGLVFMRAHYPDVPIVVVSAQDEPYIVRRTLSHGAAGFIPKSETDRGIRQALEAVLSGDLWLPEGMDSSAAGLGREEAETAAGIASLTPQQFRVMSMLSAGLLNKQIAWELDVSEATIKAHVTAIFRKLGVQNRTQAVLVAGRLAVDPVAH